jgi:hypothetical protein
MTQQVSIEKAREYHNQINEIRTRAEDGHDTLLDFTVDLELLLINTPAELEKIIAERGDLPGYLSSLSNLRLNAVDVGAFLEAALVVYIILAHHEGAPEADILETICRMRIVATKVQS